MHQLLNKTLKLNGQIAAQADAKLWNEVLALSVERDNCLKQYFSITPLPDEQATIFKIITQIAESDSEITQIISKGKKELVNEGLSLRHSHVAIQRYQNTQFG